MCGIVGFIDNKEQRKEVPEYFETLKHRGDDSYGAIVTTKGKKPYTFKSLKFTGGKGSFINQLNASKTGDFILMHNRNSSIGGITLPLAHPITHGDITVIHNGTSRDLFNTYKDEFKTLSDTATATALINSGFQDGELMRILLKGMGVIFAQHKDGRVLVHIDGNRPLFTDEARTTIASEPIFLGKWYLFKPITKIYDSMLHFIKSAEVHEKSADVDSIDNGFYCFSCGKTHLHSIDGDVCYECEVLGKEATSGYGGCYGSYSGGTSQTYTTYTPVIGCLVQTEEMDEKAVEVKTIDSTYEISVISNKGKHEQRFYFTTPELVVGKTYLFGNGYNSKPIEATFFGYTKGYYKLLAKVAKGGKIDTYRYAFPVKSSKTTQNSALDNPVTTAMYSILIEKKGKIEQTNAHLTEILATSDEYKYKCVTSMGRLYFAKSLNKPTVSLGETYEFSVTGHVWIPAKLVGETNGKYLAKSTAKHGAVTITYNYIREHKQC